MRRRFLLTLSLTIVLLITFVPFISISGQSYAFSGQGSVSTITTDTFDCTGVCHISWVTDFYEGEGYFEITLKNVDDPPQIAREFYRGYSGAVYLYSVGTFYFKLLPVGIKSWYITINNLYPEQLEPQTHFSGPGYVQNSGFFECLGLCELTWMTTNNVEQDPSFSVTIYKVENIGRPTQKTINIATFGGSQGRTYLNEEGVFYFKVDSNVETWGITVKSLDMEHLESIEPQSHFWGETSTMTEIFTCSGHCVITWETAYDPTPVYGRAYFEVTIWKIGDDNPVRSFEGLCNEPNKCWGLNGTTDLNVEGMFYFIIEAKNLDAWEITVEDAPVVSEGYLPPFFKGSLLIGLVLVLAIRRSQRRRSK